MVAESEPLLFTLRARSTVAGNPPGNALTGHRLSATAAPPSRPPRLRRIEQLWENNQRTVSPSKAPKGTLDCVQSWLTDFREDLKRIDAPTLVIHGDDDRILPIAATGNRTQEAFKGSRLVVVKGGPHGLNWTHAEQVNRELLDFLRQGR